MEPNVPSKEEMKQLIEEVRKGLKKGWVDGFLKEFYPIEYKNANSKVYIKFRNYLQFNSYTSGIMPPYQFHFKLKKFYQSKLKLEDVKSTC